MRYYTTTFRLPFSQPPEKPVLDDDFTILLFFPTRSAYDDFAKSTDFAACALKLIAFTGPETGGKKNQISQEYDR